MELLVILGFMMAGGLILALVIMGLIVLLGRDGSASRARAIRG